MSPLIYEWTEEEGERIYYVAQNNVPKVPIRHALIGTFVVYWQGILAFLVTFLVSLILILAGHPAVGSTANDAPAFNTTTYLPQTIRLVNGNDPTTVNATEPISLPDPPSRTIPNIIAGAARMYGVDAATMTRVAFCESGLRPGAVNRSSGATGLFQWIDSSWIANVRRGGFPYTIADRTDPAASSVVTAYVISRQGLRDWEASKGCWA